MVPMRERSGERGRKRESENRERERERERESSPSMRRTIGGAADY